MSSTSENELNVNGGNDLEWLNQEFLEKVLNKYEVHPVHVKNFSIQPATKKGENYASCMSLVKVEYLDMGASKTISLIIKSQLKNEIMDEITEEFNIFEREIQVYSVLLEKFENLLRTINDPTSFGPRAIYVDKGIIVQENLKEKGYGICEVKNGLDFEHCSMILQKLAKFHACSMIVYKNNPELFVHHMPANLTEKENPMHLVYTNLMASCIEFIQTIPEFQQYISKLTNFSTNIIQRICKTFSRNSPIEFYVLNHGDVWCNNLMFKQNPNGQLDDVLMVDYQEGYYGSLGIDFNYFIYSSWHKDVFINHKDELIACYHQVLSETLVKLNYDQRIPTLQDVHDEIRLKNEHGLITAACLLPILISEHEHLADPINFISDSQEAKANRLLIVNNPKFIELLQIFLEDFVQNDIL